MLSQYFSNMGCATNIAATLLFHRVNDVMAPSSFVLYCQLSPPSSVRIWPLQILSPSIRDGDPWCSLHTHSSPSLSSLRRHVFMQIALYPRCRSATLRDRMKHTCTLVWHMFFDRPSLSRRGLSNILDSSRLRNCRYGGDVDREIEML